MDIQEERQKSPVADPVQALIAVCRPIIASVLVSLANEAVEPLGGRTKVPLQMLGRLRRDNDGDCGVAFEFAIHDAITNRDATVCERVASALKLCKIRVDDPASIFYAIEKQRRSKQLIATRLDLLTEESCVLSGKRGRPVKLNGYLNLIAAAYYRPSTRLSLPHSINGLWKADLFLGSPDTDHWVGTTVKSDLGDVEAANGLRIAIIPARPGKSDKVERDDTLVICPVLHDADFMEVFYAGFRVVQVLCSTSFRTPKPVDLPDSTQRAAAAVFVERREFSVVDVLQATEKFGQPHLLEPHPIRVDGVTILDSAPSTTTTFISPVPMSSVRRSKPR